MLFSDICHNIIVRLFVNWALSSQQCVIAAVHNIGDSFVVASSKADHLHHNMSSLLAVQCLGKNADAYHQVSGIVNIELSVPCLNCYWHCFGLGHFTCCQKTECFHEFSSEPLHLFAVYECICKQKQILS